MGQIKKLMIGRIFFSLFLLIPVASLGDERGYILQTGDVLTDDVPEKLDHWFGLYEAADGFILSAVDLAVEPY